MEIDDGRRRARAKSRGERDKTKPGAKPSPVIIVALLLLAGVLGWSAMHRHGSGSLSEGMPPAPALLPAPKACAEGRATARARAEEAEQAAFAKVERSKFDAHDAIDAVGLYALSASCYAIAGDQPAATRVAAAQRTLQSKLETEYQAHQLRLRLALDRGGQRDAEREIRMLRELLRGQHGPYLDYLRSVARSLSSFSRE